MPDREKIIKGLTQCTSFGEIGITEDECNDCPYYGESYKTGLCWVEMNRDALALLKEQEAKQVTIAQAHFGMKYGLCPRCEKQIDTLVNPSFCGHCGQAVKWE